MNAWVCDCCHKSERDRGDMPEGWMLVSCWTFIQPPSFATTNRWVDQFACSVQCAEQLRKAWGEKAHDEKMPDEYRLILTQRDEALKERDVARCECDAARRERDGASSMTRRDSPTLTLRRRYKN
jgi:hypothetical protein